MVQMHIYASLSDSAKLPETESKVLSIKNKDRMSDNVLLISENDKEYIVNR